MKNPTLDIECQRCHNRDGIWDVGLCPSCLETERNETRTEQISDGTLLKRLDAAASIIKGFTLPLTTQTRRQLDSVLQSIYAP